MNITFGLTPEYRQEQLVQYGKQLPDTITKELPLLELSVDARRIIVLINPSLSDRCTLALTKVYERYSLYTMKEDPWKASSEPQTPEEWNILLTTFWLAVIAREEQNKNLFHEHLLSLIEKMEGDLQATEPKLYASTTIDERFEALDEYSRALALLQQLKDRYNSAEEEKERRAREKREAEQAEKNRIEAEKKPWIHEYGSQNLKRKFDAGYDCQRMYVLERARHEYPDYIVDFNDKAAWNERSCPSDAAFEEAQRVDGDVVYLTKPASNTTSPDDDNEHAIEYSFEPCEAVVIRKFLGKYDLVREIN